jgi:hypothetical protein
MEPSPSREANSCLATQKITNILRSPEVHYSANKIPTQVSIFIQMNPAQSILILH